MLPINEKIYSSEDFLKQGTGKNVSWRLKVEYCLKSEEENDDIVSECPCSAFQRRCSQDICLELFNNVHENKTMT